VKFQQPLQWPSGWPRAKYRARARFHAGRSNVRSGGASFHTALDELTTEVRRIGGRDAVCATNLETRLRDGLPKAGTREFIADPGVALYFKRKGQDVAIACDRWDRVADNMWAIALTIAALRGLERWGTSHMTEAAFRGFKALPEATGWSSVDGALVALADLAGLSAWEPLRNAEAAEQAVRTATKRHHPDMGGDVAVFRHVVAIRDFQRANRGAS
jgi:hypothetical protein